MNKTSLKQKFLLVLFGVFLSLLFLEAGLRMAGAFVLYLQERHNHLTFNSNEFRILCLGESTTALGGEDSYPSQLERMLNSQSRQGRTFTVINKGIISTTTNYILSHLDQNLDKYRPQMVIVMMGINDRAYLHDSYKSLWLENIKSFFKDLRVYKLGHLLYEHITHRIKENNVPVQSTDISENGDENNPQIEDFLKSVISTGMRRFTDHISAHEDQLAQASAVATASACVELARRYRFQDQFSQAQDLLKEATILDPNDMVVYQEWGEFYLAQQKAAPAVTAFQTALSMDPKNTNLLRGLARAFHQENNDNAFLVYAGYLQIKPQDYWGYIELAQWLRESKHDDQAIAYLSHAIELGPDYDQAYLDLGQILDAQGQYDKEAAFFLNEISLHPKMPRLYQTLGQFYEKQGKDDLAKKYFQQAAVLQMAEYYPVTLVNYSLLVDKILKRHIKVVVMQYPLRDIDPLKDYLGQKNGLVYVENKQNFRRALAKTAYGKYFKDNFAYNFGHCTRAGNELIARNLTPVILKNE